MNKPPPPLHRAAANDSAHKVVGSTHAPGEAETPFLAALVAVMRQRRSVRAYLPERIADSVRDDCFDLAILAPTSQNLECWQMIEVRDAVLLAALRHLCLDQPAAVAAPHLIVVVARPDRWRLGLPKAAEVVMVIAAGRGAVDGVIPQIRFGRAHYIQRA